MIQKADEEDVVYGLQSPSPSPAVDLHSPLENLPSTCHWIGRGTLMCFRAVGTP